MTFCPFGDGYDDPDGMSKVLLLFRRVLLLLLLLLPRVRISRWRLRAGGGSDRTICWILSPHWDYVPRATGTVDVTSWYEGRSSWWLLTPVVIIALLALKGCGTSPGKRFHLRAVACVGIVHHVPAWRPECTRLVTILLGWFGTKGKLAVTTGVCCFTAILSRGTSCRDFPFTTAACAPLLSGNDNVMGSLFVSHTCLNGSCCQFLTLPDLGCRKGGFLFLHCRWNHVHP